MKTELSPFSDPLIKQIGNPGVTSVSIGIPKPTFSYLKGK